MQAVVDFMLSDTMIIVYEIIGIIIFGFLDIRFISMHKKYKANMENNDIALREERLKQSLLNEKSSELSI